MRLISALLVIGLLAYTGAAFAAYPNSMAVCGDSISRAALSDDSIDDDQPEHCWSTGYDAGDACNSHYERILAVNGAIAGQNFNNARNGAKADDLLGQVNTTVSNGAQYVTIEMGGNDVCADSTAEMTPVDVYAAYFNEAIDVLQAGLPSAKILVCEVVNVRRVYDVGRSNLGCLLKWSVFGWCNNMLTNGSTQRNEATTRNIEYNNALRGLCATQGVIFDDDIYEVAFSRSQLSSIDCFHPDISLQGMLADYSYDASRF